jgi:enoyl-CoA hydratase/carnithine racemase
MTQRINNAISWERTGAVAKITITRPEKRNAISGEVIHGIMAVFDEIEPDTSIKVVTTTGAGDIAWSAGYDMDYLSGLIRENNSHPDDSGLEMNEMLRKSSKITIAVVNGFCLGGAVTVLLCHDLAIASDKAVIGLPEIFRGFPPRYVVGALVRAIPIKPAMEMLITGRNLAASEAQQLGLVNRVVPAAELQATAQTWAEEIAAWDGICLDYTKKSVYECMDQPSFEEAIRINIAIHDEHNRVNPRAAQGLEEMRNRRTVKK